MNISGYAESNFRYGKGSGVAAVSVFCGNAMKGIWTSLVIIIMHVPLIQVILHSIFLEDMVFINIEMICTD